MIPLCILLASVECFEAGDEPKQTLTGRNRQSAQQSIYSVHNYKQPFGRGQQTDRRLTTTVNAITASPKPYKQQPLATPPASSMSINRPSVANVPVPNYKQQQPVKSISNVFSSTAGN